jgi:hypothetical protein
MSTSPDPLSDPTAPASRLWWAVPAVGVILLALVAMLFGGGPETVDYGTSYDASGRGFRAAYLVLEQLKFPVERARRPAVGGDVRWVLFPSEKAVKEAGQLDDWVQRGGLILLAVDNVEFARALGLNVIVTAAPPPRPTAGPLGQPLPPVIMKGEVRSAEAPEVTQLAAGELTVDGPLNPRVWGRCEGKPLVSVYARGRGEVWLLHRPDVLTNANLKEADNPVLLARLAEAMLAERPGGRLAFDEFCHGLRDRPSAVDLLFRMPVLAVTLQSLLVTALVLWRSGVRFGPVRAVAPPGRRSKEEFLDAMADLLSRKGDRADAFRTVRDDFVHRLQTELGLPAGTRTDDLIAEAARRRGADPAVLTPLLTADAPPGRGAGPFLDSLAQLDAVAHECIRTRPAAG